VRSVAQVRRLFDLIGSELSRRHVTQIAEEVHRFVIAEHDVQHAAGRLSFRLQTHQQVHDLARAGAAIHEIAGAHDMSRAGCPMELRVDDAYGSQQLGEIVVGAVHVGEGDDALDVRPAIRFGLGPRDRQERCQNQPERPRDRALSTSRYLHRRSS